MAVSMIGPKFYAWDRDGKPLAFGKLYTYQDRTNTPKPTYRSEDQVVENTNPVILNGEGYANVYLSGSYKMVLKDDKDNEIWTSDPVTESNPSEWIKCQSATYLSPTSFKIGGNFTSDYESGRSLRIDNSDPSYSYATIVSSSFASGETVVIVSEPLVTTSIQNVCISIVGPDSLPVFGSMLNFDSVEKMKSGILSSGVLVNPQYGYSAFLSAEGRSGEFSFLEGDFSNFVSIDSESAIYIPPNSDPSGASGAWVRQYNHGVVSVEWFGAVHDLSVNSQNDTALQAAFQYIGETGETLENSGIAIRLSQLIILSDNTRYNLLGPIPTKSRVLYTTLQDPNQAGGFGAYINTDSNMFEMGLNTILTARNLAFIGSDLDRTPGNFRLFAPNADEDYHKVDVRFCALSGFNRMANFLGGSYVQHITDCRIENNDVAVNAPNACNASDFSRNSWAYNRVHFSGAGTMVTLRDGEFAFDAAYDEIGVQWEGDGHQMEGNYMEILVDTGVGDLSDRKNVQMIRWVVNKFSDRHSGFIRNNVLDAQNRTDYPLTIGSAYGSDLTFTYQPVHKNKISGAIEKDISIDAGTDLVLPDLSDNGTKTINGAYRLVTNKAQAYVKASDGSLLNSYNILSILKNGTGDFTITFGYPFRNTPSISAIPVTGGDTICRLNSVSPTSVRIATYNITAARLVDVNFTLTAEEMSQITE